MRISVQAVALVSGVALLVLGAAAQAHEKDMDGAARPAEAGNCPPPKAPPKPVRRHVRPACPTARHAALHRRHAHEFVQRRERRLGPDDIGVAPSQALVYRRELERDRRLAQMAPPPRMVEHPAPPRMVERAAPPRMIDRIAPPRLAERGPPPPCPSGMEGRRVVIERREDHFASHREHGAYLVAGRDRNGYLVWPGKTP